MNGGALIGMQQPGGAPITIGGAIGSIGIYDIGFSTLKTACDNATTAPLLVSKAWTAVPTQTLNCNVNFVPGGSIQPGASQVVTFGQVPVIPGLRKVFDTSLGNAGSILFPAPTPNAQPEWFGATPQATTGSLSGGGAVNSAAFTAAQQALPVYPLKNAQGLVMNTGLIKIGNTGDSFAYPLASTFLLSPYVCLAGDDNSTAYLVADRGGFTGSYLIDSINRNGTGQTFNNNFNQCIRNFIISTINPAATATIGGVNWNSSLNSHLDHGTISVSGAPCVNGPDGRICGRHHYLLCLRRRGPVFDYRPVLRNQQWQPAAVQQCDAKP